MIANPDSTAVIAQSFSSASSLHLSSSFKQKKGDLRCYLNGFSTAPQYGTFSDMDGENIVIFTRNADKFMKQNLVPCLGYGHDCNPQSKGRTIHQSTKMEGHYGRRPWNNSLWTLVQQPHQAATPFLPYIPMQQAQPLIAPRPASMGPNGQPDANDPGHPGQPALFFQPMRPNIPEVREQPAVDANHCLKTYLLKYQFCNK